MVARSRTAIKKEKADVLVGMAELDIMDETEMGKKRAVVVVDALEEMILLLIIYLETQMVGPAVLIKASEMVEMEAEEATMVMDKMDKGQLMDMVTVRIQVATETAHRVIILVDCTALLGTAVILSPVTMVMGVNRWDSTVL